MKKSETMPHTVRFPPELYAKIRKLAELEYRPINGEIVMAVEKSVADYERKYGEIVVENVDSNQ